MSDRPKTRLLSHSLVYGDGETEGQKASRVFAASAADYADTLKRFPPTRVSIAEFEADMRAIRESAGPSPDPERLTP